MSAHELRDHFMLIAMVQRVEQTLVSTSLETVWFDNTFDLRNEMFERFTLLDPDYVEPINIGNKKMWEVESVVNPSTRGFFLVERVPARLPWSGYVGTQQNMWEILRESSPQ